MGNLVYSVDSSNEGTIKIPLHEYGDSPFVRSLYFHGSEPHELCDADAFLSDFQSVLDDKVIAYQQPCDFITKRDVGCCLVEEYFVSADTFRPFIPVASTTGAHLLLSLYESHPRYRRVARCMQSVEKMILISPDMYDLNLFNISLYKKKMKNTSLRVLIFCDTEDSHGRESLEIYQELFGDAADVCLLSGTDPYVFGGYQLSSALMQERLRDFLESP